MGCLDPARLHTSQLLQYLTLTTNQATKWPAGADFGHRQRSWRGHRKNFKHPRQWRWRRTRRSQGVEGVGMRVTSGGATRIWNKKLFILTPKIGEMIPFDLHMFFHLGGLKPPTRNKWWENGGSKKQPQRHDSGGRKHQVSWFAKLSSSL